MPDANQPPNVTVTINTIDDEFERDYRDVSLDAIMVRVKSEFPNATSFVLAFCA